VATYFASRINELRGGGRSYGGWTEPPVLKSRSGGLCRGWTAIGRGLIEDTRNLLAADIDGDGRMDLIVTTSRSGPTGDKPSRYSERASHVGTGLRAVDGCARKVRRRWSSASVRLPDGTLLVRPLVAGDSIGRNNRRCCTLAWQRNTR